MVGFHVTFQKVFSLSCPSLRSFLYPALTAPSPFNPFILTSPLSLVTPHAVFLSPEDLLLFTTCSLTSYLTSLAILEV